MTLKYSDNVENVVLLTCSENVEAATTLQINVLD